LDGMPLAIWQLVPARIAPSDEVLRWPPCGNMAAHGVGGTTLAVQIWWVPRNAPTRHRVDPTAEETLFIARLQGG
jgi:hypothetical protein